MSTARQYELVYIALPDTTEEGLAELHTQIAGIVERLGGSVERTEPWGRRKLPDEIGRHREGRAAVEGERGAHHSPVAQGQQLGQSSFLRSQHGVDGTPPVLRGLPRSVHVAGASLSQGLARCIHFRPRSNVPRQRGCPDTAAASGICDFHDLLRS